MGNFPRLLGLAYIFAQIVGAFLGALVSWFLLGGFIGLKKDPFITPIQGSFDFFNKISDSGNIYPNCEYGEPTSSTDATTNTISYTYNCSEFWFAAIWTELIGSFFVCFFFLNQTEEKTRFGKERAISCFIIAASYVGARGMLNGTKVTCSGPVLNPAISIGTNFTMLFDQGGKYFSFVWLYGLVPIGGAVLAVLFHELVFKKTQEVVADEPEEEDGEDNLLDK